ncbi:MAG: Gfo/Idh/MocA family oxidoreductase [Verrucomicrobia bacterium]|nr:Gfo/Idh/MocA family oxidoreductase [Verrucomicrobiota bacterium]
MKFIIVGLGFWGQTWTKVLEQHAQAIVVAVVDPSEKAHDWAQCHLGVACYPVLSDALSGVEADAVLIANPPSRHKEAALEALSRGKHVLIEKPLATSMEDAVEIADGAERSGAKLMVAQGYRFTDGAGRVRELVGAGEIGTLRSVRVTFRKNLPDHLPPEHSIYSWRHSLVIDMGVHHFDLMRFITRREFIRAFATEHETPDNAFAYPSNALCLLRLEGELPAVWDADWSSIQPETAWEGDWELVGATGRLFWRGAPGASAGTAIWVQRPGKQPEPVPFRESVTDRRDPVLAHFIEAVSRGLQPEPGVRDNLKTLRAALGCVQSMLTGAEVRLD